MPIWNTRIFLCLRERKRDRESQIEFEKAKLKRLMVAKAPQASIDWVSRQVRYLCNGGYIAPIKYLSGRISKPVMRYVENDCHDTAIEFGTQFRRNIKPEQVCIDDTIVDSGMDAMGDGMEIPKSTPIKPFVDNFNKKTIPILGQKIFDPGGEPKPTSNWWNSAHAPGGTYTGTPSGHPAYLEV